MIFTTIVIVEQEQGEPEEDISRVIGDIKRQLQQQGRIMAETGFSLADGRKKTMFTEFQRIIPKKQVVVDAIKIIEGAQREDA
jgi:hypothetical protein